MAISKKLAPWSPRLLRGDDEGTPEIGYVAIAELHYDWLRWENGRAIGYQRPCDDRFVDEAVANYDPHLIGSATLNRREDGSLWVLDGQHRIAIEARMGKAVILATIYSGLTREQEAETYNRLNTRRRTPNQWNRFGSRVFAGEPIPNAVVALAAECGFKVGTADRALNSIAAVNVLERLYALPDGPRLLRHTLTKITDLWPTAVVARDGVYIEGLARLTYTWDGSYHETVGNRIDWRRFDNLFSLHTASDVVQRAKLLRLETGIQMGASTYALAMRDIYNGKANFQGRLTGTIVLPSVRGPRHVNRKVRRS